MWFTPSLQMPTSVCPCTEMNLTHLTWMCISHPVRFLQGSRSPSLQTAGTGTEEVTLSLQSQTHRLLLLLMHTASHKHVTVHKLWLLLIFELSMSFPLCFFLLDIDECAIGTHNCSTAETCYNIQGSFRCLSFECPSNYRKVSDM